MRSIGFLLLCILAASCQVGPKPIAYGEEFCHSCRMTIVDTQHAAQLVTDKGKVFNFDAIECMVTYYLENKDTQMAHILVNDYLDPGKFLGVHNATFLISPEISSPMGANLSAVSSLPEATALLKGKSGDIYDWKQLITYIKSL